MILAAQPTPWLHKFHTAHATEAEQAGLGADWKSFRSNIAEIRRRGYYVSHGELEPEIGAAAVPLPVGSAETAAAIAVVARRERFGLLNETPLIELLLQAAERIAAACQPA